MRVGVYTFSDPDSHDALFHLNNFTNPQQAADALINSLRPPNRGGTFLGEFTDFHDVIVLCCSMT
jgi:hypothetical protein